jgi:hypothetical protein
MKMKATNGKTRNKVSALLFALAMVVAMAVAAPSAAAENAHPQVVTVAKLAGSWQATVIGQGPGCGFGSKLLTFTLNSSGDSTEATWAYSTVGCSTFSESASFAITSLNSDGSGTAQLTVGGSVFNWTIQVNSAANLFNIVDITDSGNYEEGSAIKQ